MALLTDHLRLGNVIFRDITYTPVWVNRQIDILARYLDSNARSNSPFVYLFAANHVLTLIAYFAIIKSGRVCVLVNPRIGKLELEEFQEDTPPLAEIHTAEGLPGDPEWERYVRFTNKEIDESWRSELDDVCMIAYTAASDGYMKGAMLTNKGLLADAEAVCSTNNVNKNSVSCAIIPLYHLFALQTGVIAPCISAGTVQIAEVASAKYLRNMAIAIPEQKTTHMYSVPAIYSLLRRLPAAVQVFQNVQSIVSGGSKLTAEESDKFLHATSKLIREGYGITEASPVCTWHKPGDETRVQSVGKPFPCCEIIIVDENDNALDAFGKGEVCVKGTNVMKGYFRRPRITAKSLRNGMLHTGDEGYLDSDGYLYLTGVLKSMLNLAGEKVYPLYVERLLRKNPAVVRA